MLRKERFTIFSLILVLILGLFLGLLMMMAGFQATAQEIPDPPVPQRLVVDYAGVLSQGQLNALEHKLVAFNDTTSTQIAVVIVNSLSGLAPEDFANRLGEKWGVGRKGKDNGVVVLVKAKKDARDRGEAWISTGYGMEGVIPDALAYS